MDRRAKEVVWWADKVMGVGGEEGQGEIRTFCFVLLSSPSFQVPRRRAPGFERITKARPILGTVG